MGKIRQLLQKKTQKKLTVSYSELLNLANLGNTLLIQGKLNEAIAHYRKVLAVKPDFAEVHNNLGIAFQQQGKVNLAIESHQQALLIKPDYAQAHLNLGMAFNGLGKFDAAIAHYQQTIVLEPNYADAHYNLGMAFKNHGSFDKAIASYQRAISLNPKFIEAYLNLGLLFNELDDFNAAINSYQQALLLKPDYAEAHFNLGIALKNQGSFNRAIESYRQAIFCKANFAEAKTNLGFLLLSLGSFAEGWRYHESRHETDSPAIPAVLNFPNWRGESVAGKSLIIWREQGLGDEIQFCRYVEVLKAKGARQITWVCKKPLKSLLTTLADIDVVLSEDEAAAITPHDYWTFPLSIPLYCETTAATIPAKIPYLYSNPKLVKEMAASLKDISGFKVGICWKGSPKHKNDYNRTPGIEPFKTLFKLSEIRFFTLQPETRAEFMNAAGTAGVDMGREIDQSTFEDAAALIANLDLVISCDTSVCHLAGALGKPVWIVLPFEPDWRWLREREDSPWYPTARLFRQTQRGDWDEVFKRIEIKLKQLVNQSY